MVLTVQNSDAPSKRFGLQSYILITRIVNVLDFLLFSISRIEHKNYSSLENFWLILSLWTWILIIDLLFVVLNVVFSLGLNYFFVKNRKIIWNWWILDTFNEGIKMLEKYSNIVFTKQHQKQKIYFRNPLLF